MPSPDQDAPTLDRGFLDAMLGYLEPGHDATHTALISAELKARLAACRPSASVLKLLLKHASLGPSYLFHYLDHHGDRQLSQMIDWEGDPSCVFDHTEISTWPVADRQVLLRRLLPYARTPRHKLEKSLLRPAFQREDHDLLMDLDKVGIKLAEHISALGFPKAIPERARSFYKKIVSLIDLADPQWNRFATEAFRTGNLRNAGIVMALGYNPKRKLLTLTSARNDGDWRSRLLARLSESNHAELAFMAAFPSVDEIISMDPDALKKRIAGLNAKQQKSEERRLKREASRQHFISKGLPLPEGLKNPDEKIALPPSQETPA